jgi:hypothetical protein
VARSGLGQYGIAEALGEVEIERLRESRSEGRSGQSFGLERQVEPLVMASEMTGLPPLRGYLKLGNLVVRLSFPFLDLPRRAAALLERPVAQHPRDLAPAEAGDGPGPPGASTAQSDAACVSQRHAVRQFLERLSG